MSIRVQVSLQIDPDTGQVDVASSEPRWRPRVFKLDARNARTLGGALRRVRETIGAYQADVSAKLGKDQSFLSKVENGRRIPAVLTLIDLADQYGYDVVLVERPPTQSPPENPSESRSRVRE